MTACLTSTPCPYLKHTPPSSKEGVSQYMYACVCVGREWMETNASSTHLHAQVLCHINPLSMCVYVWVFNVQHERLPDSSAFPDLTRRANVRLFLDLTIWTQRTNQRSSISTKWREIKHHVLPQCVQCAVNEFFSFSEFNWLMHLTESDIDVLHSNVFHEEWQIHDTFFQSRERQRRICSHANRSVWLYSGSAFY